MLVDCLMQVYRIGFLVTSLPVNCNDIVDKLQRTLESSGTLPCPIYAKLHMATALPDSSIQPVSDS